jgi:hypothetical protein
MSGWRNWGLSWVGSRALPALVLVGMPRAGHAQAPPWLVWAPPAECPSADYVEGKVEEGLGGPVPSDVDLVARAEVVRFGAEWEVRVELRSRQGTGERRVRVRDCTEAADFVALAVTLAMNRDLAVAGDEGTPLPTEDPAPPLRAEEATAAGSSDEAAPARHGPPFRLGVQVGALGSVNALPNVAFGFEAGVTSALGPWQARAAFRWYPAQEVTVPEAGAEFGDLAYEVLGGALALGYRARFRSLVFIHTLTAEIAQLEWDGGWDLWVRMEGGLELALATGTPFEPFVSLGLSVPLSQPSFSLIGDVVAHRPGLGGAAALGLRAFFLGR